MNKIYLFKAMTFFLAVNVVSEAYAAIPSFKVPNSWLGENIAFYDANIDNEFKAGTSLILKAQANGLKEYNSGSNRWHLHSVTFDLGIGLGGNLGMLLLRGTPGFQLYWRPKPPSASFFPSPAKSEIIQSEVEIPNQYYSISNDGPESVSRQIGVATKAIFATGRVRYNPNLEQNLQTVAQNYFDILDSVSFAFQKKWALQTLRLDLFVSGNGMVHVGTTVGGALRIQFRWAPHVNNPAAPKASLTPSQQKVAFGFENVIRQLIENLDYWTSTVALRDYHPALIRVGIGVNTGFNVGVVRAGAGALVQAQFVPRPQNSMFFDQLSTVSTVSTSSAATPDRTIPILQISEIRPLADILGIIDAAPQMSYTAFDIDPIQLTREQIVQGLNRAMDMGSFFLSLSTGVSDALKWELWRVKTNLDISLSGSVRLVTIGGLVALELWFDRNPVAKQTKFN